MVLHINTHGAHTKGSGEDAGARRAVWRIAATYFAGQGIVTAAWWWLMLAHPDLRPYFFPASVDAVAFLPPDFHVVVIGSFAVAGLIVAPARNTMRRFLQPVLWLVVGGVWYAAALTIVLCVRAGSAWLGGGLMLAVAACATLVAAWVYRAEAR